MVILFLFHLFSSILVEDVERNDGSIQRPYYMSRRLMKILAKDEASEAYWSVQQGGTPNFNNSY